MLFSNAAIFLFVFVVKCQGFTHWVVTENGRIEPKLDTHFYLRRPYDLLALLDQETRRNDLEILLKDMENQQILIDKKSKQASFLYGHDCTKALKDLPKNILANNGSDRIGVTYDINNLLNLNVEPNCTKFSDLPFSMYAFEHFESMQGRNEHKRETCDDCIPELDWSFIRNFVVSGLTENKTSWFHYNLGTLYWWHLGHLSEAYECARRAIHFAPRNYLDIPIANLGQLMYMHSEKPEEAISVIKSAINYAPSESKYYLLLGQAYIRNGDYESGARIFEHFKNLQQKNNEDVNHEYIKCLMKLLIGFKEYQEMLEGILSDLHEFHNNQQRWLSLHERLIWEIAPYEFNFPFMVAKKLLSLQGGERCRVTSTVRGAQVVCNFSEPSHMEIFKGFKDNMENILENYRDEYNKFVTNTENLHNPKVKEISDAFPGVQLQDQKFSVSMSNSNDKFDKYFDSPKWPTKEECINWDLPLKVKENLNIPIFTPLENKGFQVTKILSDDIGVPQDKEHDLPWHPPLCDFISELDFEHYLPQQIKPILEKNKPLPINKLFVQHFMGYINGGKSNEAEIGQRIVTAIKKKAAPDWVLAILANMYWRTRENTKNAMRCLYTSVEIPKSEHFADVVLVSMGSMLQQMGFHDIALKFASLAFRVNFNEPSTNFLLALIHYQKDNPILAIYYLKNVVRADPNYYDGEAERLLRLWSCRIKLGEHEEHNEQNREENRICTEGLNTEGVICSANGEECKTAAIQCFKNSNNHKKNKEILTDWKQCAGGKPKTSSFISNLVNSENSQQQQDFHMRIFFGNEELHATSKHTQFGDFYVSIGADDSQEVLLHVYDKSGTYALSKTKCKNIKESDWEEFTSMWETISSRNINIAPFLSPLSHSTKDVRPYCVETPSTLDQVAAKVLRKKLPNIPDSTLSEWLNVIAGDNEATVMEIGARIGVALKENATSWMLATAAALYWRVVGNSEQAVICLRQALTYVPLSMRDIPLINLADILHKVGFISDALEMAYLAIESHPDFVVNHYTAGNIYTSLGDFEKAISFYRSSLELDANFGPARNRLQAILCTLLFDEAGFIREAASSATSLQDDDSTQ